MKLMTCLGTADPAARIRGFFEALCKLLLSKKFYPFMTMNAGLFFGCPISLKLTDSAASASAKTEESEAE